eukprot:XP_014776926.1 PREDICTED: uncharacterized protein LOC106873908 [Octopus bimaculoides]
MSCDNPNCDTWLKPVRECHHPMCAETGKSVFCRVCDIRIHKQEGYQGHLVIDVFPFRDSFKSDFETEPQFTCDLNISDEEQVELEFPEPEPEPDYVEYGPTPEPEPEPDYRRSDVSEEITSHFVKHNASARMSTLSKRLKRKDAVKRRPSMDAQNRTRSKSLSAMEIGSQIHNMESKLAGIHFQSFHTEQQQQVFMPEFLLNEIQFYIETSQSHLNLVVLKGKTIQDLLAPRLNVDVNSIDFYLEGSNSALPLYSLANRVRGNRIYLRDRENRPLAFIKEKESKKSPYSGLTKQKKVNINNLSIDETQPPKPTIMFGNKFKDKDKLEQMYDILKRYVHKLPSVSSEDVVDLPPSLLENSWRDIVRNASELPKEIRSQQEVIWELLSTEITYIESLQVITTRFRSCLQAVQKELPGVMKEIEIEKLFSNIVEVFAANSKFWKEYLCESLKVSRQTHEPINPSLLKDGFTKFPELMKPYQRFCADQIHCQNYIKAQCNSNEYFKNFVVWAESNTNLCKRLRLIDIIITPMQRLTRYSLLLRRIKETSVEEKQKEDLEKMIQTVENFVSDVNLIVGEKRESDKLNAIASRIESYEGCEAPNEECVKLLNHYNQKFTLTSQMPNYLAKQSRCLLHHCSMKFKDSTVRQDVECYLFTDLLLICKLKKLNDRLKVLKPPIRVDQISLAELKDKGSILVIQTNDYIVPIMAFILHADSASIKNFIEHINKAKLLFNEANQPVRHQLYQTIGDIKTSPKIQYRSSFQEGKYDKFTDPSPSPKFHEKSRPNSFSFTKQKLQNSTSEQTMISPLIVCESPSPETQTGSSLLLPTSEMKTSHSMPSCASSDWLSRGVAEETKCKSERKRKTEKRYNTADSIQELKRKEHPDNTIHKRFSWNSGSTHKENRQSLYKHVSSDSIRSSSGVSSTCSSHLSPDHENNENEEETTPVNVPEEPLLTEPNENYLTLNTENKSLSKSMPDIAALLHDVCPSEMKDGISSVDITGLDVNYEGLNHTQVLVIKKYLLLNSNNESEV